MITIKDFMECIDYRITDGSEYMWYCYGEDSYYLDSVNGDNTVNIVFDTKTQVVYEMQAWDNSLRNTYRWINPDYISAVKAEYKNRALDYSASIDNEKFIDLDVAEDMLEKASAISKNQPYDTRVQVDLTLSDPEMYRLMTMAHEMDMTLNQLVEHILTIEIEQRKSDKKLSMTKNAIRKRKARAEKRKQGS